MSLLDFLLVALAGWRLTSLLVWEAGPWDLLYRMRHAAGIRYNEQSEREAKTMLGRLLLCPWCTSVWVGVGLAFGYWLRPDLTRWLALPLAISAATVLLEKASSHGEG